jgi:hypothetical protein
MADASLNAKQKTDKTPKPKEKSFFGLGKVERLEVSEVCTLLPLYQRMTSLYDYAAKDYDWITMEWGGFSEEEEEFAPALYQEWSCVTAEAAVKRIFLPLYGPVNRDGVPLGYVIITE